MRLFILTIVLMACGRVGYDGVPLDNSPDAQAQAGDPDATPAACAVNEVVDNRPLAVGYRHSCIIRSGQIWCWGDNEFGQLGIGDQAVNIDQPVPVRVGTSDAWIKVVAGLRHSCALDCRRALWCWGGNDRGQLGNTDVIPGLDSSVPIQISGDGMFSNVFAGRNHTCTVGVDGALWCWGANTAGALGLGDNAVGTSQLTPAQVGTERWEQVAVSQAYSCGLRAGQVWCWGDGRQGNLGNGSTDDLSAPATVVAF